MVPIEVEEVAAGEGGIADNLMALLLPKNRESSINPSILHRPFRAYTRHHQG